MRNGHRHATACLALITAANLVVLWISVGALVSNSTGVIKGLRGNENTTLTYESIPNGIVGYADVIFEDSSTRRASRLHASPESLTTGSCQRSQVSVFPDGVHERRGRPHAGPHSMLQMRNPYRSQPGEHVPRLSGQSC